MKSEIPKIDPIIDNMVLPKFLESQELSKILTQVNRETSINRGLFDLRKSSS